MAEFDTRIPKPRIKLELREKLHLQMEREGKKFTFLSRVIEQTPKAIVIEYPTALEGDGILMVGDSVEVALTRADAIWGFVTRVTEKVAGQQPVMKLAVPRTIERNQRRRYVRVDWLTSCRWRPIFPPASDDPEIEVIGEESDGTIHNISAGGVLMAADDPPQVNECLIITPQNVNWPLPGAIMGRIVWRRPQPPEYKFNTTIGVDFRDLEEVTSGWSEEHIEKLPGNIVMLTQATRHKLMQSIYLRQIELRKKGIL